MEIKHKDILLRDWRLEDIDDEIRWMNTDTQWIKADTPWETFEPVDGAALRKELTEYISNMPQEGFRGRLEIETCGKHIGFVCTYLLDENYEQISLGEISDCAKLNWALGIEICEPAYWCRGLGAQALVAFIRYLQSQGKSGFCLETWSGNKRMLKCAEKLGFSVCKRQIDQREEDGAKYDGLVLALDEERLREFENRY